MAIPCHYLCCPRLSGFLCWKWLRQNLLIIHVLFIQKKTASTYPLLPGWKMIAPQLHPSSTPAPSFLVRTLNLGRVAEPRAERRRSLHGSERHRPFGRAERFSLSKWCQNSQVFRGQAEGEWRGTHQVPSGITQVGRLSGGGRGVLAPVPPGRFRQVSCLTRAALVSWLGECFLVWRYSTECNVFFKVYRMTHGVPSLNQTNCVQAFDRKCLWLNNESLCAIVQS